MNIIKTVLVDDQILFVENLKIVLEHRSEDIKVIGIAKDGKEAVSLIKKLCPDIVLMDVRMPKMDGVEAARILSESDSETKILMLTTFKDDEYVLKALQYGAVGYLLKNIPPNELIASIRLANEGTILISPSVISAFMKSDTMQEVGQDESIQANKEILDLYKTISKREKEVLKLITKAFDNREIAERLFLSEQTVKNYIYIIYSKLDIHDRVHVMKLINDIPEIRKDLENL
jgi:DNA-binding NarL/FixJ family response regulator